MQSTRPILLLDPILYTGKRNWYTQLPRSLPDRNCVGILGSGDLHPSGAPPYKFSRVCERLCTLSSQRSCCFDHLVKADITKSDRNAIDVVLELQTPFYGRELRYAYKFSRLARRGLAHGRKCPYHVGFRYMATRGTGAWSADTVEVLEHV